MWAIGICGANAKFERVIYTAIIAPIKVTTNGRSFNRGSRTGSFKGEMSQFIVAPPITAPLVKNIIGVVVLVSLSLVI